MKIMLVAAAILAASFTAQAAPLFSDTFDADPTGSNITPTGWNVSGIGGVDVIGYGYWDLSGSGFNIGNPYNRYIDLAGSYNGGAGLLSHTFDLTAGTTYTATYWLTGNPFDQAVPGRYEDVTVTFGTAQAAYVLYPNASYSATTNPWTIYNLSFTPLTSGTYTLNFQNGVTNATDNDGAILDNVSVTAAVPEPETYAMMMAGLGMIGVMVRRRKRFQ
jgi:hypothetical protein